MTVAPAQKGSKYIIGTALAVVVAAGLSFPFFYSRKAHVDHSKRLPEQAAVRGAYINSGSKDVGPDPKAGGYSVRKAMSVCPLHPCPTPTATHSLRRPGLALSTSQLPTRLQAVRWASSRQSRSSCRAQRPTCSHSSHHRKHAHPHPHSKLPFPDEVPSSRRCQQAAAALLAALEVLVAGCTAQLAAPPPAAAILISPNAQIPRTVDAALRRSIPAFNQDVRSIQDRLEDIAFKLRIPQRKPWPTMMSDVDASIALASQRDKLLVGVPPDRREQGTKFVGDIQEGLRRLRLQVDARDPGKTSFRCVDVLRDVAELELLQAPGLPFSIPKEYESLPRLTGRAVVELDIERQDGSLAYVNDAGGGPQQQARLQIVLDGYSAPISAGNFAVNVLEGRYRNKPLNVSYASVLAGAGATPGKVIPLEQIPAGEFEPQYRVPIDVQSGELPTLPLSIYGAVAMAHVPDADTDGYSAGDEFFVYKFDRQQAGLAGLSFDEGQFGVFGYVTGGAEIIPQLASGDVIVDAKLVLGKEKLVMPPTSS